VAGAVNRRGVQRRRTLLLSRSQGASPVDIIAHDPRGRAGAPRQNYVQASRAREGGSLRAAAGVVANADRGRFDRDDGRSERHPESTVAARRHRLRQVSAFSVKSLPLLPVIARLGVLKAALPAVLRMTVWPALAISSV